MEVDGQLQGAIARPESSVSSSIAALTSELEQLVEILEADWSSNRRISRRNAKHLHYLRVRAEQLLP
jgi:hypothetical protein